MAYLARLKEKIPLKEIAKKENISFDYLEKIISKLEKAGLVLAKKGSKGGYFLAKPAKKIKIGEIIKTLEGEISFVKCIGVRKNHYCPREKNCLTRNFWKKLKDSLDFTLNSITLEDLIKEKKK